MAGPSLELLINHDGELGLACLFHEYMQSALAFDAALTELESVMHVLHGVRAFTYSPVFHTMEPVFLAVSGAPELVPRDGRMRLHRGLNSSARWEGFKIAGVRFRHSTRGFSKSPIGDLKSRQYISSRWTDLLKIS
jgi:hypothetical protein